MASVKMFLEVSINFIILLAITPQNCEASPHNSASFVSLLTDKLHSRKQPVVLIIAKDQGERKDRASIDKGLSAYNIDENGAAHLIHHLLGHDKIERKLVQPKRSTKSPYIPDDKKSQRPQRIREDIKGLQKEDRNILHSPIVKKLLRISNSLRCEAKDECQDKCKNKFYGIKVKKCHVQCEIKYVCEEEEEEEKDPCIEEGCADSCGQSGECKGMSTKGVPIVTERPGCARC